MVGNDSFHHRCDGRITGKQQPEKPESKIGWVLAVQRGLNTSFVFLYHSDAGRMRIVCQVMWKHVGFDMYALQTGHPKAGMVLTS